MVPVSPGVLSRIEVVDPPYIAPMYTPASIISATAGFMPKVRGSSSAMAMTMGA